MRLPQLSPLDNRRWDWQRWLHLSRRDRFAEQTAKKSTGPLQWFDDFNWCVFGRVECKKPRCVQYVQYCFWCQKYKAANHTHSLLYDEHSKPAQFFVFFFRGFFMRERYQYSECFCAEELGGELKPIVNYKSQGQILGGSSQLVSG